MKIESVLRHWVCGVLCLCAIPVYGVEVAGTLQWARRAELGMPVSGVIAKVLVEPGQRVGKGQVLVQLDDRRYRADLAKAHADVERLAHLREEAKREQGRAQELYDRNLLSTHELEVEKIAFVTAESEYQAAKAAESRAELNVEYCALKAPFDALVLDVRAELGQTVASDLAVVPLVVIADAAHMLVKVAVDEATLATLTPGRELSVQVSGQHFNGTLRRLALEPVRDSSGANRYPVEIMITTSNKVLRAGQSASVVLP